MFVCMHMHIKARQQSWLSFPRSYSPCFSNAISWLASTLQGFACLFLFSAGIPSTSSLLWVLGIKLRSCARFYRPSQFCSPSGACLLASPPLQHFGCLLFLAVSPPPPPCSLASAASSCPSVPLCSSPRLSSPTPILASHSAFLNSLTNLPTERPSLLRFLSSIAQLNLLWGL